MIIDFIHLIFLIRDRIKFQDLWKNDIWSDWNSCLSSDKISENQLIFTRKHWNLYEDKKTLNVFKSIQDVISRLASVFFLIFLSF